MNGTDAATLEQPCRRAYSREEMIAEAQTYLRDTFGPCLDTSDMARKYKYHECLGMLVDFIHDRFPSHKGEG